MSALLVIIQPTYCGPITIGISVVKGKKFKDDSLALNETCSDTYIPSFMSIGTMVIRRQNLIGRRSGILVKYTVLF